MPEPARLKPDVVQPVDDDPASQDSSGGRHSPLVEWLLRSCALLAYAYAVTNLALIWWKDQSRLTILVLLITEGVTLFLVLLARPARARDTSAVSILLNFYAWFSYVLFDPRGTTSLIAEPFAVALQMLGTAWQFSAKWVLGRSFGVLPARRGLVFDGPYRVVRHPIYLGYAVGHLAFLLANFSLRNALVLTLLYVVQILRIRREERILSVGGSAYQDYQKRTPWKLIPGVF